MTARKKKTAKPRHSKKTKGLSHDWDTWKDRYTHGTGPDGTGFEFTDVKHLADTWEREAKAQNKKFPAYSYIRKVAAQDKWKEEREALEQAARVKLQARRATQLSHELEETLDQAKVMGGNLFAAGANYIIQKEKEYREAVARGDKSAKPVINSLYEALATMRHGSKMKGDAIETLLRRVLAANGPTEEQLKHDASLTAPRGQVIEEGGTSGVVFLPPQASREQWEKERRQNLGAQGLQPAPAQAPQQQTPPASSPAQAASPTPTPKRPLPK